jgi:HD superfamily phosphodiesterase
MEDKELVNNVLDLAITYNGNDIKRINHLLKVFSFAHHIGVSENCDPQLQIDIDISAILHDSGIHEDEKKYNSSAGKWQEIEGPKIAQELLKDLPLENNIKDRVLFLIGHHHSYNNIDGIDFQILVEADFLVNMFEDGMAKPECLKIKQNIFKTKSGIKLLEGMYI